MSYGGDAKLFSNAPEQYADPGIRPTYPRELFQRIYTFCGPGRDLALDVATGTGQCAGELAKDFHQVHATDANKEQIAQCKTQTNVQYHVACAEETKEADNSVDLVTVASALHWFNARAFYREVRRVLKPQGSLAAWAYMPPQIKDREVATAVVYDFFFKTLYPYMETPHKEYMAQYRGIEPTATEFEIVTRDSLDFGQSSSIRRVVQFAETTGVLALMRQKDPHKENPIHQFEKDLLSSLETSDLDMPLNLVWHTFILLAKGPLPLRE